MKRIGILSDTHGFLDPRIMDYFSAVDEIWHAGDIGSLEVLDQLRLFKPTRAVYGNIDDHLIPGFFKQMSICSWILFEQYCFNSQKVSDFIRT
jgi:predicted phosphodiesterase